MLLHLGPVPAGRGWAGAWRWVTAFAMYVTVMYLTMTIASPFAGKLLQTMDIRILLVRLCRARGLRLLADELLEHHRAVLRGRRHAGLGRDHHPVAGHSHAHQPLVRGARRLLHRVVHGLHRHRRRHLVRRVHRADRLGRRLPHDLPHLGRHRARHESALHAVLRAQLSRGLRAGPLRRLHAEGGLGR